MDTFLLLLTCMNISREHGIDQINAFSSLFKSGFDQHFALSKFFPKRAILKFCDDYLRCYLVPVTDYEMALIRIYGRPWNQCELFFVDKACITGTILCLELLQLWFKGTAFFVMNCFSLTFFVFFVKSVTYLGRSAQRKFIPQFLPLVFFCGKFSKIVGC